MSDEESRNAQADVENHFRCFYCIRFENSAKRSISIINNIFNLVRSVITGKSQTSALMY